MDRYNHFDYGLTLARQHRAIGHTDAHPRYFTATEQEEFTELEERISAIDSMVLVAIDGGNSDYLYAPDNLTERKQFFFLLLCPTDSSRPRSIYEAQQRCATVGKQIIARLLQDSYHYENGLETLDRGSFIARGAGPVADNLYGSLIGFNLNCSIGFEPDPALWNLEPA